MHFVQAIRSSAGSDTRLGVIGRVFSAFSLRSLNTSSGSTSMRCRCSDKRIVDSNAASPIDYSHYLLFFFSSLVFANIILCARRNLCPFHLLVSLALDSQQGRLLQIMNGERPCKTCRSHICDKRTALNARRCRHSRVPTHVIPCSLMLACQSRRPHNCCR